MSTIKVGQGGIASGPGGPNNIPMNNLAAQQPGGGNPPSKPDEGVPTGENPQEVIDILKKISESKSEEMVWLKPKLSAFIEQLKTPELIHSLQALLYKMDSNANIQFPTSDPETGILDKTAQQTAEDLLKRIKHMIKSESAYDNIKESAEKKQKDEDDTTKKKSRGNPFRVLMGQVGKLLDHGMSKRDITKYLLRKGYWPEKTISDAVDVVKDYNKKKHSKPKEENKSSFNYNKHRLAQFIDNDQSELMNKVPFRNAKPDSDMTPTWSKRSTAELIARAAWLKSAKNWQKEIKYNEGRETANVKGVASELKQIRAALKNRGFTEEEIP